MTLCCCYVNESESNENTSPYFQAFYSLCQNVLTVQNNDIASKSPKVKDNNLKVKDNKKTANNVNSHVDYSHSNEDDTIQLIGREEMSESSKKWTSCCSIS